MKNNLNSDKIVWSDNAIDELQRRLTQREIEPDEIDEVLEDEDYVEFWPEEIEEFDPPTQAIPIGQATPVSLPPTASDFPWPISVKSTIFWYGSDMKSNADVTLTVPDVDGVDEYEFRITRA